MIKLTKKDKEGSTFWINHKKIERIFPLKDTVVLIDNGEKIIVNEKPEEIVSLVINFESEVVLQMQNKKEV